MTIMKSDNELSPELKEVARDGAVGPERSEGETEAPFSGKYWNNHENGMYKCAIFFLYFLIQTN